MKAPILILFLFLSAFTPTQAQIVLDGTLNSDEWRVAKQYPLAGGGACYLMDDNQNLYIGIRGVGEGWSHVYVLHDQRVHVLHASAALGSIVYAKDLKGKYQTSDTFSWSMRDPSMSGEAVKERSTFLMSNGWVASTNRMGNKNEIEFIIDKNKMLDSNSKIVVVYATDPKKPQYWPQPVNDDCIKPELLYGSAPADLHFSTEQWAKPAVK